MVPEPVLLDEWQMVPGVLGAVKRAVDQGSGAGRFLLTGGGPGSAAACARAGGGGQTALRICGAKPSLSTPRTQDPAPNSLHTVDILPAWTTNRLW